LLTVFAELPVVHAYTLAGRPHEITVVKLAVGILIIFFALFELIPFFGRLAFDRKYLPLGGMLSGFFGGLSGNQGALRSAFLIKAGLDKEAFIGTGTVAGLIVDISRLIVYGVSFYAVQFTGIRDAQGLVIAAILAAFLGAFLGTRLVKKVTFRALQIIVGVMLIVVGTGMATGLF